MLPISIPSVFDRLYVRKRGTDGGIWALYRCTGNDLTMSKPCLFSAVVNLDDSAGVSTVGIILYLWMACPAVTNSWCNSRADLQLHTTRNYDIKKRQPDYSYVAFIQQFDTLNMLSALSSSLYSIVRLFFDDTPRSIRKIRQDQQVHATDPQTSNIRLLS